jgi:hypothetical protein
MTSIPTLATVTDAETLLDQLAAQHEWVSVFWDKRGRHTPEISIIVDGEGQEPKAWITEDVHRSLISSDAVGEDTSAGPACFASRWSGTRPSRT